MSQVLKHLSDVGDLQKAKHTETTLEQEKWKHFYTHNSLMPPAAQHYSDCCFWSFVCSRGHCEELHCWLWQNANFQQDSPRTQSVLQCTHTSGSLHRVVWWVCVIKQKHGFFIIYRKHSVLYTVQYFVYLNTYFLLCRHYRWESEDCFAERS